MYIRNKLLRGGLFLVLLLIATFSKNFAQNSEVGVTIRSLSLGISNPANDEPLNPSSRLGGISAGLYWQKNQEKKYIRYLVNINSQSSTSTKSLLENGTNIDLTRKNSSFFTSLGFEIGKNINLGKGFRLQAGAQFLIGATLQNKASESSPLLDLNNEIIGSRTWENDNANPISFLPSIVLRADYQLSKRVNIGIGLDWGLAISYLNGNDETTLREYNLNGVLQSEGSTSLRNERFNLNVRSISRPMLNIGINLGK